MRGTVRGRWPDVVLGLAALLFGLHSLAYPFGRDQGLFFYAAREWLRRGQVLYRDVWEHKPPIIYLIHMGSIAVFGEHLWGIRVLELFVAVPLIGFLGARLSVPPRARVAPGAFGAAWLWTSVFYFGYFDYWSTAQCEIWCALFALAGLVLARDVYGERRAQALAGAMSALVLWTKPPALPFVALTGAAVLLRAWGAPARRGARLARACLFACGGALTITVPLLGYFAAKGALPAMFDILVRANGVYLAHEPGVTTLRAVLLRTGREFRLFEPFSGAALAICAGSLWLARLRRDFARARPYLLAVMLFGASWADVLMQLKFYGYHWGTLPAGIAVLGASVYRDLGKLLESRKAVPLYGVGPGPRAPESGRPVSDRAIGRHDWRVVGIVLVSVSALFFGLARRPSGKYRRAVGAVIDLALGRISREQFAGRFDMRSLKYSCRDAEVVGTWLRDHSTPTDTVSVRGFEPEVYAIAERHYTGRFFWTTFLWQPGRAYRREELLKEDRGALERNPPAFIVALAKVHDGIDSAEFFAPWGYASRFATPSLVVLAR